MSLLKNLWYCNKSPRAEFSIENSLEDAVEKEKVFDDEIVCFSKIQKQNALSPLTSLSEII